MSGRNGSGGGLAALVVGGVVFAAGGLLLHYLTSGVGEDDASLIPNAIEDRLDRIVDALNRRFGKQWVQYGIDTLRSGLASVLPQPMVQLVSVVHQVEQAGIRNGWTGYQKRCQAAGMCQAGYGGFAAARA